MSKGNNDDELSAEESQALLQSLNARASSGPQQAAEDDGPDEDLEAYLASLEGDDAASPATTPAASKPAAPDPFADAFSQLEAEHGHAVSAPPPKKIEAPAPKPAAPAPQAPPKPEATKPAAPPPEPAAAPPKPEAKKPEAAKKPGKVHAVETVRSRQFILATAALKFLLLATPVALTWWLAGALLSRWVATGWMLLLIATIVALVPAIALRLATGKGRALWWAAGLGLVSSVALIAGAPAFTGAALIRHGHWPTSSVSQLAGWQPDNIGVRAPASVSAWIGAQISALGPAPVAAQGAAAAAIVPSALGTEQDLKVWAEEARKKAAAAPPAPAAPTAPAAPAADAAKPAEAKPEAPAAPAAPAP